MQDHLAGRIENTQIHRLGVQIDTTKILMRLGVEFLWIASSDYALAAFASHEAWIVEFPLARLTRESVINKYQVNAKLMQPLQNWRD